MMEASELEIEWLRFELENRDEIISSRDRELSKQAERLYQKDIHWQEHMSELRDDFQKLLEAPQQKKGFFRRMFGT